MNIQGSICAIVTPLNSEGRIDTDALLSLLNWHIVSGTDALVLAGSTGESASLEEDEFCHLLNTAVQHVAGRIPIIAGCGAPATHKAARLMRIAHQQDVSAALVVTPCYVRPTQEGLYQHYTALSDKSELPIILYNVPSRTACDISPETVVRLLTNSQILGIKEARADVDRMQALLTIRRSGFAVYAGDDATAVRSILQGADGVVSVAANVCPQTFQRLCALAKSKQRELAVALNHELIELYEFLGIESNPIPVKWLLARLGYIKNNLRLPLMPLSSGHIEKAEVIVKHLMNLEPSIMVKQKSSQSIWSGIENEENIL